jgi:hypothetical protein
MEPTAAVRAVEATLRRAIERRDFTRALELLDEYRDVVTHCWHALEHKEERQQMAASVLEFMHWARRYVLIAREQFYEQSMRLSRPLAYLETGSPRSRVLQMRG